MPHEKMQEYVNIDYRKTLSIVGVVTEAGGERIIAEGRYVRPEESAYGDTAFVVAEAYQEQGIATTLLQMLMNAARKKGLRGFTADVLADNKAIIKVYEKAGLPVQAVMEYGVYHLAISFPEFNGRDGHQPEVTEVK